MNVPKPHLEEIVGDDSRESHSLLISPNIRPLIIPQCPLANKATTRKCYHQLKVPWLIIAVSFVQILLYVAIKEEREQKLYFIFNPNEQEKVWRFLSYMFMHKDAFHLLQNILLQTVFAIYLESFEGKWRTLCVYLGGGIGGALGAATVRSERLLGASAGVYALLLSHVSFSVLRFRTLDAKHKIFLALTVLTIVVFDIGSYSLHYVFQALPTVSWGAHVFGALVGLLLGFIIYSNKWSGGKKTVHQLPMFIGIVLLLFVAGALILCDVRNTKMRIEQNRVLILVQD